MTEFYIDRIDWHFLGKGFPENLPQENGGIHIGMYLAWIINNDLIGEFHLEESKDTIEAVRQRLISGNGFLINECDSKFCDEDLNDEGSAFTYYYYNYVDEGNVGMRQYIYDYAEMFIKEQMSFYEVEDSWENYDKIKAVIDERYRSWKVVKKIYDQYKS